jgi:hypothetical protein
MSLSLGASKIERTRFHLLQFVPQIIGEVPHIPTMFRTLEGTIEQNELGNK